MLSNSHGARRDHGAHAADEVASVDARERNRRIHHRSITAESSNRRTALVDQYERHTPPGSAYNDPRRWSFFLLKTIMIVRQIDHSCASNLIDALHSFFHHKLFHRNR